MTEQFTPEIFSSELRMKQFFQGDDEIAQIKQRMAVPARPQLLYNRWDVIWICFKMPGQITVTLFLSATVYVFKAVGAESLSRRCIVIIKHLEYNQSKLDNFREYRERFLVPTLNAHAKGTEDVYLQSMLPFNKVDRLYQTVLAEKHPMPDGFEFMNPDGVCQGIGDWAQYLFAKTLESANDPRAHLTALAEQFTAGASKQASLLQTIYFWKTDYLKLEFEAEKTLVSHADLNSNPQRATQAIQDLDSGAYAVYFLHHRIDYFKYSNDLSFILDPNKGLIAVNPQEFLNIALKYHYRDDPRSQLTVQKTILPRAMTQTVHSHTA